MDNTAARKVNYRSTSCYANTPITDYYLDTMVNRPIPRFSDDVIFTINATYENRPDLLAFDLYEHSDLWWVFAQRNPNVLVNPLNDFKAGVRIFLPKLTVLKDTLGF